MHVRHALAMLALVHPVTAQADVSQSADNSTLPECIRVSPDGSMAVQCWINRTDGSPHAGETVRLIFSLACSDLAECSGMSPLVYSGLTSAAGIVEFNPQIGGCCMASAAAEIEVDPGAVTFSAYSAIGSPDNDGSLDVALDDFVRFQAAFLTSNQCHDLAGCDGEVFLPDFVTFQSKFLVGC